MGQFRGKWGGIESVTAACGLAVMLFVSLLVAVSGDAKANTTGESEAVLRVATLNWPPYTSRSLPKDGAVSAVVRAAFAEAGHEVRIRFWPWNRAIAKAKSGAQEIVAYFPGYHCHHDQNSDFIPSDPMGTAPLGFAEHTDTDHSWHTLDDLSDLRIGTVVGYANTPAFDDRVEKGEIRVITSSDDATNLYKLLKKQIDYAAVDKYVMQYLLKTNPKLRKNRHSLQFDENILDLKNLYLCFRDDETGRRLRRTFNQGLAQIEAHSILKSYLGQLVRE
jgi:polar amino acid transport system substrate-binding protein